MNKNIEELNQDLYSVLNCLNELNNDNFNNKFKKINFLIRKIENNRDYMKKNYSLEKLRSNCDTANNTVKHINSKIDSMIETRKEEQQIIKNELSDIVNKKKLINYQR